MVQSTANLVETIPNDLRHLALPGTLETGTVLLRLVNGARNKIALTAVYWNLLHHPESADESDFTVAEIDALGAAAGRELYEALLAAAARGVQIRILQSPGFLSQAESASLVSAYPGQFTVRQVDMGAWYGGGILHQKLWLVDDRHFYLGSANMDWRSLSQVKELGLVVENDPTLTADLTAQFDAWWQFAALGPAPVPFHDSLLAASRPLPCWSPLLRSGDRCALPFTGRARASPSGVDRPLTVHWNDREATAFTAASPPALCVPGRTKEIDALRYTLDRARHHISLSVMHFAPMTLGPAPYSPDSDPSPPSGQRRMLWWPVLFDALLRAACRGVRVRLLASRWAHTPPAMIAHLNALQNIVAASSGVSALTPGGLEVRLFTMPGWDDTLRPDRRYPGHSRVNHPKFLVTEQRLNVSTSNMAWGDFAWNGGISLNTDHPDLVRGAREIFDRDWHSRYALPLNG